LARSEARKKLLAPSGKSPAYVQHRKNSKARAGNGRGLFRSTVLFAHGGGQTEDAIRLSSNEPKNLTRRANHRHIFIIARILEPAPGNWPRAFSIEPRFVIAKRKAMKQSGRRRTIRKNLTRRANHRHIFTVARIFGARAGKLAAGFFNRAALFACRGASR
jgi:hypothetical protein